MIDYLIEAAACLLYTSDAADDLLCVDLGGRRLIKKNTHNNTKRLTHHPPRYQQITHTMTHNI